VGRSPDWGNDPGSDPGLTLLELLAFLAACLLALGVVWLLRKRGIATERTDPKNGTGVRPEWLP
jgi:hypothetical protein